MVVWIDKIDHRVQIWALRSPFFEKTKENKMGYNEENIRKDEKILKEILKEINIMNENMLWIAENVDDIVLFNITIPQAKTLGSTKGNNNEK